MFQLKEIHLNVGRDEAQGRRVLFVSDIHAISFDKRDSAEVLAYEEKRCEEFRQNGILDTKKCLEDFVDYANEICPDVVVFGGDIIDCPSIGNLSLLKEQFERLKMPFLYTSGNHDWNFGWDYRSKESREKNFKLLCDVAQRDLEAYCQELFGIQFLVLDSSEDCVREKALHMLTKCDKNRSLCIVMHVPFSTMELRKMSMQNWNYETTLGNGGIPLDEVTEKFYKGLGEFPDCIILGGHVHGFDYQVLTNGVRQIVAAAGCNRRTVELKL